MKHESCKGCKHNLGGGHCRINEEKECREGGGFELWEENIAKIDCVELTGEE